jgi:hypothetical protein
LAKFPEPPASLPPPEAVDLVQLPRGSRIWRIYFRGGWHPTFWNSLRHFGPTGSRFDHHLAGPDGQPFMQVRGILYAASLTPHPGPTCFAEAFQQHRPIDRRRNDPWLVAFDTAADLTLLDLRGLWPTRAGASTAIFSGPRPRARRGSRAIYTAYPETDGLIYPSSIAGHSPSLALFERSRTAIATRPAFNRALADPSLDTMLANAAADLRYRLV